LAARKPAGCPNGKIFPKVVLAAPAAKKQPFSSNFCPQVSIGNKSTNRIVADLTKRPRQPFNRLCSDDRA
jgi:hypothetical protein